VRLDRGGWLMLHSMIANVSIVVSFMFIVDFMFRKGQMNALPPTKRRWTVGVIYGVLGCVLMLFGIEFASSIVLDLRHIAVILAAFSGGLWASMIAGLILALFRTVYFGISEMSAISGVTLLIMGLLTGLIAKLDIRPMLKFHLMNIVSTSLVTGVLYWGILDKQLYQTVAVFGWPISIITAAAVYAVITFLNNARRNTQRLKESEADQRRTVSLLKTLLEYIPGGLMVENEERRIIYMNREMFRLYGDEKHPKDWIGKNRLDFLEQYKHHFREPEDIASKVTAWSEAKVTVISSYFDLVDGRVLQLDYVPITEEGDVRGQMWKYRDVTPLKNNEKKLQEANTILKRLSGIDGLTGIANRRSLDEHYQFEWDSCTRSAKPLTVLLIDVDDFKLYNDAYGHLQGDICLKMVAEALEKSLERSDDFAARYGGEEFAVLLPDTTLEGGARVAERIRETIEALQLPQASSEAAAKFVSVSIGICCMVPVSGQAPMQALELADRALYTAKQSGRNRVVAVNHKGEQYVWQ
jgi:diguanylate cyclase (GGDEF)-like protein